MSWFSSLEDELNTTDFLSYKRAEIDIDCSLENELKSADFLAKKTS